MSILNFCPHGFCFPRLLLLINGGSPHLQPLSVYKVTKNKDKVLWLIINFYNNLTKEPIFLMNDAFELINVQICLTNEGLWKDGKMDNWENGIMEYWKNVKWWGYGVLGCWNNGIMERWKMMEIWSVGELGSCGSWRCYCLLLLSIIFYCLQSFSIAFNCFHSFPIVTHG